MEKGRQNSGRAPIIDDGLAFYFYRPMSGSTPVDLCSGVARDATKPGCARLSLLRTCTCGGFQGLMDIREPRAPTFRAISRAKKLRGILDAAATKRLWRPPKRHQRVRYQYGCDHRPRLQQVHTVASGIVCPRAVVSSFTRESQGRGVMQGSSKPVCWPCLQRDYGIVDELQKGEYLIREPISVPLTSAI